MDCRHRKNLPSIWLMTDERVPVATLLKAVQRLPRGKAGIIFRHYRTEPQERRALFNRVSAIATRRRLPVLLAGSAQQAASWRAAGWHGPDAGRTYRNLLHSAAVHSAAELFAVLRMTPDLIFLSPLFPTRSHPGAPALGVARFAALARLSPVPVVALGGVRARHRPLLQPLGAAGWGAIDGLVP